MRSLGLSLLLAACTLENPAFHASATDGTAGSSSTAPTEGGGSATTAPTTTTSPTTSPSTTGPDGTTHVATTMNVSDSDATTDPPSTSSTTEPPMTASSEPGSTTDPMMCVAFPDQPGPYTRLQSLPNFLPVPADECAPLQQTALGGRLEIDAGGFFIHPDPDCLPDNLFVPGIRVMVQLPPGALGNGSCVNFSYLLHPGYSDCVLSAVWVEKDTQLLIVGSFGNESAPPETPFQVEYKPENLCVCPGCCAPFPDPDAYKLVTSGGGVGEGNAGEVVVNNLKWAVSNLRAHVHAPDCTSDAPVPEWLHLDWVAARVP